MKKTKTLATIALATLFTMSLANADTQQQQPTHKQTINNQDDLKRFNSNVGIKLTEYGVGQDDQGQTRLFLQYEVENRGKRNIKSVHWVAALAYDGNVIYAQDVPANFEQAIQSKTSQNVVISVLFSALPQAVQQAFSQKAQLQSVNGAKEVVFTNGSRIVVK